MHRIKRRGHRAVREDRLVLKSAHHWKGFLFNVYCNCFYLFFVITGLYLEFLCFQGLRQSQQGIMQFTVLSVHCTFNAYDKLTERELGSSNPKP